MARNMLYNAIGVDSISAGRGLDYLKGDCERASSAVQYYYNMLKLMYIVALRHASLHIV